MGYGGGDLQCWELDGGASVVCEKAGNSNDGSARLWGSSSREKQNGKSVFESVLFHFQIDSSVRRFTFRTKNCPKPSIRSQ